LQLDSVNKKIDIERNEALFNLERSENQLRLQQQQVKLYEREVSSLRSLLHSFDAEFRFGKPEASDMLRMKDEVISTLRADIDLCREEANKIMSHAMQSVDLDAEITKLKAQLQLQERERSTPIDSGRDVNAESARLREQVLDLQNKLEAAQKAMGTDYIPGKPRYGGYIER